MWLMGVETELDEDYDAVAPLMEALFRRQQLLIDSIERINEQFDKDLGYVILNLKMPWLTR